MMDTKLKKSTKFYLQTDGQTEVVNRTFIHILKGYCNKHPKFWDEQLRYIQHAYIWAKHSSTNTLPFEACFCYLPSHHWTLSLRKMLLQMDIVTQIRQKSSLSKFSWYITQCKSNLKRVKAATRQGMTNTGLIINSKLVMKFGCK